MADSKDKTSMPSAAAGNPMGLAMPWFQQVVSTAFAVGLQYVNFEGIVTDRIGVTVDADTVRYAIIASLALALGMLSALVNAARAKYNVAWPFMMLNQVSAAGKLAAALVPNKLVAIAGPVLFFCPAPFGQSAHRRVLHIHSTCAASVFTGKHSVC